MRRIVLATMFSVSMVFAGCGENSPDEAGGTDAPTGDTSLAASCVETYSLETLAKREYAFDGAVTSITPDPADGPDKIEFDVETWFKGGEGSTAVRQGSFGVQTSAGGGTRKVGDRLLVAGDDDFVWDCGFTQAYDDEVAADWDEVFKG